MDEQEIFNQIKELQKQRTSLKEQDNSLAVKIIELRDKLRRSGIKKGTILIIIIYSAESVVLKIILYLYMS